MSNNKKDKRPIITIPRESYTTEPKPRIKAADVARMQSFGDYVRRRCLCCGGKAHEVGHHA